MKTVFLFILLMTSMALSQNYYISTIESDSLGQLIRLGVNEAPAYVMVTDSLTDLADSTLATNKTLEFYVFIGDSTGYSVIDTLSDGVVGYKGKISSSKWALLSVKDDGTSLYSVTLQNKRTIPLTFNNFVGVVGLPKGKNQIYIMPYIVSGVGTAVHLKIGTIKVAQ